MKLCDWCGKPMDMNAQILSGLILEGWKDQPSSGKVRIEYDLHRQTCQDEFIRFIEQVIRRRNV